MITGAYHTRVSCWLSFRAGSWLSVLLIGFLPLVVFSCQWLAAFPTKAAVFLNDRNVFLQNYKSLLFVGENGEFGPFRSDFFRYNDCFWVTIGRNARSFPSTSLLLIIIRRVFLNNRIRYEYLGKASSGKSRLQEMQTAIRVLTFLYPE